MLSTAVHSSVTLGLILVAVFDCLSGFPIVSKARLHLGRHAGEEVVDQKVCYDHEIGWNNLENHNVLFRHARLLTSVSWFQVPLK